MGTLTRIALNIFIVVLAIAAGFYQIYLKPVLAQFGIRPARVIQPSGNKNCKGIPELQACEGACVSAVMYRSPDKVWTHFNS